MKVWRVVLVAAGIGAAIYAYRSHKRSRDRLLRGTGGQQQPADRTVLPPAPATCGTAMPDTGGNAGKLGGPGRWRGDRRNVGHQCGCGWCGGVGWEHERHGC